jgi:hypothetical protein
MMNVICIIKAGGLEGDGVGGGGHPRAAVAKDAALRVALRSAINAAGHSHRAQ